MWSRKKKGTTYRTVKFKYGDVLQVQAIRFWDLATKRTKIRMMQIFRSWYPLIDKILGFKYRTAA